MVRSGGARGNGACKQAQVAADIGRHLLPPRRRFLHQTGQQGFDPL